MVLFHDLWKFTIKTFQERENLSIKQGKGKNKLSFQVICLISLSVHYMCATSLLAMKILQHQKIATLPRRKKFDVLYCAS